MITCREATAWLLEADLSEFEAPVDRAVAEHVTTCNGCAARAARIVGDTTRMARAIARTPSRPWRPRSMYVATALLAASILVLLFARGPRTAPHRAPRVQRTSVAAAPLQPASPGSNEGREQPSARSKENVPPLARRFASRSTTDRRTSAVSVTPVALEATPVAAVPTQAVRLDSPDMNQSAAVEARPSLAVDVVPSTGRYAVLGSTPKVTVVWFY